MSDDDERRRPAKAAEWVTFGVATAVLLAVVALILLQIPGPESPATPSVRVGEPIERGDAFYVPVAVRNGGGATAENVQINATLTLDDGEVTADQTIDFLAGGEEERVEFVFEDDPADGALEVTVGGSTLP